MIREWCGGLSFQARGEAEFGVGLQGLTWRGERPVTASERERERAILGSPLIISFVLSFICFIVPHMGLRCEMLCFIMWQMRILYM